MFSFGKKAAAKKDGTNPDSVDLTLDDDAPPPPRMTRQFSITPENREAQLLEYVTAMNRDHENVDVNEGLELLHQHGVNVLFKVLSSDDATGKPFGNKGYFALNSICFSMCSQADGPDNSEVVYEFLVKHMERFVREEVVALLLDTSLVGLPVIATFSRAWEANKSMTKEK